MFSALPFIIEMRQLMICCLLLQFAVAFVHAGSKSSPVDDLKAALSSVPPQLDVALSLCERRLLPSPLDLGASFTDGHGVERIEDALVRSTSPSAVLVLACFVEAGVTNVSALPDRGSRMLYYAAERKHVRLLTHLLKRGANASYIDEDTRFSVMHAALSNRLLLLDIATRLLNPQNAAGSSNSNLSGLSFLTAVSKLCVSNLADWDRRVKKSCDNARKHGNPCPIVAEPPEFDEQRRAIQAISMLMDARQYPAAAGMAGGNTTAPESSADELSSSAAVFPRTSVSAVNVGLGVNGLSFIMLQLLVGTLTGRESVPQLVWSRDALGRTPLHVAAAAGNEGAALFLTGIVEKSKSMGVSGAQSGKKNKNRKKGNEVADGSTTISVSPSPVPAIAYVNAEDVFGLTPAALACAAGHWSLVRVLQRLHAEPPRHCSDAASEHGSQQQQQLRPHEQRVDVAIEPDGSSSDSSNAGDVVLRTSTANSSDLLAWCGGCAPYSQPTSTLSSSSSAAPRSVKALQQGDVDDDGVGVQNPVDAVSWPPALSVPPHIADAAVRIAVNRTLKLAAAAAGGHMIEEEEEEEAAQQQQQSLSDYYSRLERRTIASHCEIDVLDARLYAGMWAGSNASLAITFLRQYALPRRPVLLRGAAAHDLLNWGAALQHDWSASSMLHERGSGGEGAGVIGELLFRASQIPYAKAFGVDGPTGGGVFSVSLRDHAYALLMCDWGNGVRGVSGGLAAEAVKYPDRRLDHDQLCGRYITSDSARRGDVSSTSAASSTPSPPQPLQYPFYVFDAPLSGSSAVGQDQLSAAECDAKCAATQGAARDALLRHLPLVPYFLNSSLRLHAPETGGGGGSRSTRRKQRGATAAALVALSPAPRPQFFIGGIGSGSPMHFHKDAVNIGVYGLKRWYLYPPACAVYSVLPASAWVAGLRNSSGGDSGGDGSYPTAADVLAPLLSDDGTQLRAVGCSGSTSNTAGTPPAARPLECSQDAGDTLFVPSGWGHAVLNLELSVGAAIEYSSPLSRY